jgi:phenylacetate-coenzyme A ligase PaaK-like adenylate-forming protein
MHLRENHIIPEIIDENGHVLPDGEYGELVITTIGADAMPLIRYRTGDFTRILPPCPCGGVTKRIDRVSRGGAISMEAMDSTLFAIPGLVDYRARLAGKLHLDCLCLDLEISERIRAAVRTQLPQLEALISISPATRVHRPLYPAKRYIIR